MTRAAATSPERNVPTWGFHDRMRKVRFDVLGIHQADMADKLGVTKAAYAAWESGRTQPRDILAVARRVELLSGVPAAWVLGVDEPAPSTTDATRSR